MTSEERDNEGGVDLLTEPGLCRLQKYCPRLARALSTAAALSRPSAEQRKHVYLPIGERGWVVSLSPSLSLSFFSLPPSLQVRDR